MVMEAGEEETVADVEITMAVEAIGAGEEALEEEGEADEVEVNRTLATCSA